MSAREELHESMCRCGTGEYPAPGECVAVDRLIDAYAHELAQKIRALDWNGAADLIDPGDAA